jgi:erythronate-4-phosphate dehydrogenase
MRRIRIVADEDIPFLKGVLEPYSDIEYYPGNKITGREIANADALIIRTRTKCNRNLLQGSGVRFIASATIGFDHIDTGYCREHNIEWTNAPGCNSSSVQQYIGAALIALSEKYGFSSGSRTIGVVGVGHVGTKVVKLTEHLGMTVLMNDPPRMRKEGLCGFVSLDGIVRDCDIISFHVPLNMTGEDRTYHMIDDQLLGRLNPGTFIINTSRGEVADTGALKRAAKSGKVKGLVIDVWENEPDIDIDLLNSVDIATPHIAGYSADGKASGTAMSVRSLSRFFCLGLDDWKPSGIPVPDNTLITLSDKSAPAQENLARAIISTYNIMEDDRRIRMSPGTFEEQRANYPLRREFDSYSVRPANKNNDTKRILRRMGFKIIN